MRKMRIPSAYHGPGWRPRETSLSTELAAGKLWRKAGVDSEWGTLREVLLHLPSQPKSFSPSNFDGFLHLEPLNWRVLRKQILHLAHTFRELGIRVHFIDRPDTSLGQTFSNLFYVRDLFLMTPEGAIIARMASQVRAGEERWATATLGRLGIPIILGIGGSGCFEGADALWVNPSLLFVGLGNRTNPEGFSRIQEVFARQGSECIGVPLPGDVQHLLGVVQVVDRDLAVVRPDKLHPVASARLDRDGFRLVEMPESKGVVERQAMNFVVLGPRTILMASRNPRETELLRRAGIKVVAKLEVSELLKAAGGIACATGILHRKLQG